MEEAERELLLAIQADSDPYRASVVLWSFVVNELQLGNAKGALKGDWVRLHALIDAVRTRYLGKPLDNLPDAAIWERARREDKIRQLIVDRSNKALAEARAQAAEEKTRGLSADYLGILEKIPLIVVEDEDAARIQTLLNELRDAIRGAEYLREDHRQRLLSRLEKLQREFHKTMSDQDRVWGFLTEAFSIFKAAGTQAIPALRKAEEMARICGRIQRRFFGLPDDSPIEVLTGADAAQRQLPPSEDVDEEKE